MSVLRLAPQLVRAGDVNGDQATLVVAGREFRGWTRVEVSRSIDSAAATFGFEATARWPDEPNPIRIRPLQECQVYLGTDLVVNGLIDAVSPSYSATSHAIQVTGRSLTGQLVDCSAVDVGPQLRGQTVLQIARRLAAVYGVGVDADVDVGDAVKRFVLEPGETVFAAIERLARLRQLLVTDTPDGTLLLTRAGETRASGALAAWSEAVTDDLDRPAQKRPVNNVLEASASFDASQRYTEYRCRGQSVADDQTHGESAAHPDATETDDGLDVRRVLVLTAEGPADRATCRDRATWEAATRAGKSVSYQATVQGWRQTDGGDLWQVNQIVPVRDQIIGLEADLLVTEVQYTLGPDGTRCAMRLAPRQGYLSEPPRRASKGSANVGAFREIATAKAQSTAAGGAP